jgi:small subunit ribosomal protein S8
MDVVGDFITILRNASAAGRGTCDAQWSTLRSGIAEILKNNGFIKGFAKERSASGHDIIRVFLKYVNGVPAITEIGRIGKPGRRRYAAKNEIPSILGGMGECVVSTSSGVLSGKDAKRRGLGGELMCYVL